MKFYNVSITSFCVLFAFLSCGKKDEGKTESPATASGISALNCANTIERSTADRIFAEDVVDKKPGEYRLVQLDYYVEYQLAEGDRTVNMHTRAMLSPNTDLDSPTATQEIVCSDLRQTPDGSASYTNHVPLAISRNTGEIKKDFYSESVLYGSNSKEVSKLSIGSRYPDKDNFLKLAETWSTSPDTKTTLFSRGVGGFELVVNGKSPMTKYEKSKGADIKAGEFRLVMSKRAIGATLVSLLFCGRIVGSPG
jgi:hypothetical protein